MTKSLPAEKLVTPMAPPAPGPAARWVEGLLVGLAAAFFYTLSNIGLRELANHTNADGSPPGFDWAMWVCFTKTAPAALAAWGWIAWESLRGIRGPRIPFHAIALMLVAGLVMQVAGNSLFQVALVSIGLAVSVGVTFGSIIIGGSLLSRAVLGETQTWHTVTAQAVLMLAIGVLTWGATQAPGGAMKDVTPLTVMLGAGLALASGFAFGAGGVAIRKVVRDLPVIRATAWLLTSGAGGCGLIALATLGWQGILATTSAEMQAMVIAGFFNACGFFLTARAFQLMTVDQVNMANATQIAMACLAGVLVFAEPFSLAIGVGTALTIVGLVMMRPPATRRAPAPELSLPVTPLRLESAVVSTVAHPVANTVATAESGGVPPETAPPASESASVCQPA